MLFSSKCPLPALTAWCRTLKHSLGAGLDPIRIFRQQGKSGPRALRPMARDIVRSLEQGNSLEDSLAPFRERFPPLFVELVSVGEQTGRLEDTFHELEAYFETTLRVQRNFRSQMTYPVIQFVAAVLVISALIFILGMLGSKMDPLGLGLTGTAGAVTFMGVSFGIAGGLYAAVKVASGNLRWRARLEGFGLWVPVWGGALSCFALHRFCIAMRMTTEAGLRAEKVLYYAFRATANAAFMQGADRAVAAAKKGKEIHEALAASRAPFPDEFRDMVVVAEESGEMSEVMERLAENYREDGARKLKAAAEFTSYAIYAGVGLLMILAIYSIAKNAYIDPLNNATKGF